MKYLVTLIFISIALIVGSQISPKFLDANYLLAKLSLDVPIAILSIAMTYVIISGHIDLSVASGTVLVSVVAAMSMEQWQLSMPIVALIAIATGLLLGLFNGLLVVKLRLPSLVATLGTLALFRGVSKILIQERAINDFPDVIFDLNDYMVFPKLIQESFEGFPLPVIFMLILALIAGIILRFTTFGRTVYAIGTNESAARYSGLPTKRTTIVVFMISGFAMSMAALANMAQLGNVDYKALPGGELVVITAVVLGTTSIYGGSGSVLGTVLAMFLLVIVRSALGMRNIQVENQLPIIGGLLILAVAISQLPAKIAAILKSRFGGKVHA